MIAIILLFILLAILFGCAIFIIRHYFPCKDCIFHDKCKELEDDGEPNICTRNMLTGHYDGQA